MEWGRKSTSNRAPHLLRPALLEVSGQIGVKTSVAYMTKTMQF